MPHARGHYRNTRRGARIHAQTITPHNPYPYMSWPEAIVHLELERRRVRFSHRYFRCDWEPELCVYFQDSTPYEPEFTLPDQKIVITVLGEFWGSIPGVIDRQALAKVVLESKGWRFIVWYERDILQDIVTLFKRDLPDLRNGTGGIIPRPGGPPNYLVKLRRALAGSRRLIVNTRGTRHQSGRRLNARRRSGNRTRRSRIRRGLG